MERIGRIIATTDGFYAYLAPACAKFSIWAELRM
jgi:hypothetical protein